MSFLIPARLAFKIEWKLLQILMARLVQLVDQSLGKGTSSLTNFVAR